MPKPHLRVILDHRPTCNEPIEDRDLTKRALHVAIWSLIETCRANRRACAVILDRGNVCRIIART